MGASRTGATDLQPADARYPGSPLRLRRRYGEQAYAESKNRHPDPHTRPIHLHGMASRPAAGCVPLVSAALMTYSITQSARPRSYGGIVSPSALAVLRLMTSSNCVGCSTGRSAGLAPLRILST